MTPRTTDIYTGSILMLSLHGYVAAEPELGRPDTGGQVTFVLQLAKQFASLGYRVDIVTRRFERQPAVDRMGRGVKVWRIPFGGREFLRKEDMHDYLDSFVTAFLAEVHTRELNYDIVSSHYWDAGYAGQRIADELGIPHIHTPHSLGSWKQKDMGGPVEELERKYRFKERIKAEYLVYRSSDHLIATTNQQLEVLKQDYGLPEENVTVIPPGMDEHRYTPAMPNEVMAARQRFGLDADSVYAVGRAAANKGYDLLIRAIPHMKRTHPPARVFMAVGAGSERDRQQLAEWRALAVSLGVDRDITWKDYILDEEMADHYRAAGVFALCSRYEPFGMTAVESMACGTPVVLTVHGGLHDLVDFGTHALFADPEVPEEFGTILGVPLRYPALRNRLSVEGARFSRRHFGWSGIAKTTLAVFERFRGRYRSEPEFETAEHPQGFRKPFDGIPSPRRGSANPDADAGDQASDVAP